MDGRLARSIGVFFLTLLGTATAQAQETTGALTGRVLLVDSSAAEGVRVVLSGTHLQGERRGVSDATGTFRFLALPPGEYTLRLVRIGLRPVTLDGVVVDLGRSTGLAPIVLEPVAVQVAEQRIEASEITVDPVRTTGGGTIRASEFAALPTERDFKALIPILPQVNVSYRGDPPNVAGSTGLENQYFIDGMNVSDARIGDRATTLPYNFVRAVDVKTGGYEARYGRALGAVVSAVTYSGTNDFEASAFAFVQPQALSLRARTVPGVSPGKVDSYDIGLRVGGPIIRDRLWYSAALNPRRAVQPTEIPGIGDETDVVSTTIFAGKLTWQASERSSVEMSVFGDPGSRQAVIDPVAWTTGYVATSRDPYLYAIESGGPIVSLRGTFTPSSRLLLEAALGRQWERSSWVPRTATGRDEPLFVDEIAQTVSGGTGGTSIERNGRFTASLHATLSSARHTVVGGVEYDDAVTSTALERPGLGIVTRLADGATWMSANDGGGMKGSFHNRSPAVFLQDTWTPGGRLTVNVGARWSQQALVGASGRVAQRFENEWQPRVGFSLVLDGASRSRVFGSFGRFYQALPNNMAVLWFVDYPFLLRWYDADPRLPGANILDEFDGSTPESDYATRLPGLEAENLDEYTVGFERLLGEDAKLTVRAIHRNLRSSFQFGWSEGSSWAFGTPGEGDFDFLPPPQRDYGALEVSGEGAWRSLRYRASYVLSRTWGNYSGLANSDLAVNNPGGNFTFFNPFHAVNTTGYLPTDRRHVAKVSGSWPVTSRLLTGAFVTVESGSPVNVLSPTTGIGGPRFLAPRGSAGRTPGLVNLDLRIAYDLPERGRVRSKMVLDLLRVGNPQGVTRVDENLVSAVDQNGGPTLWNSRYGKPLSYQPPMAARLGLEVIF